jgi:hypothetical protein
VEREAGWMGGARGGLGGATASGSREPRGGRAAGGRGCERCEVRGARCQGVRVRVRAWGEGQQWWRRGRTGRAASRARAGPASSEQRAASSGSLAVEAGCWELGACVGVKGALGTEMKRATSKRGRGRRERRPGPTTRGGTGQWCQWCQWCASDAFYFVGTMHLTLAAGELLTGCGSGRTLTLLLAPTFAPSTPCGPGCLDAWPG